MVLDIATVIELTPPEVTDEIKHAIIKNRLPGKDFKFPPKQYNDRREASGVKQRYCLREWFEMYDTLCYSKSTDGVFCFCCTFFSLPAHHGKRANNLVSVPCHNWKNARADFSKHVNLEYHRDSKSKMDAFIQMMATLLVFRTEYHRKWRNEYRAFLTSIIKCIELCGRQGIGLRGHRDDANSNAENQGNFKSLIFILSY